MLSHMSFSIPRVATVHKGEDSHFLRGEDMEWKTLLNEESVMWRPKII